jgi:glycosyltransferase involved in cell wall biosynthesis
VVNLSILLPTRNRLEYLRFAIETVRRQDCPDWEIVVSDNASEDDIGGYVAEIGDPRIIYRRSDRFVSVTENWNLALAASSGDYVVMLGDDDGLMPGYVSRVHELAKRFAQPELIYTSALLLTYPGVEPAHPGGFLAPYGYATFLRNAHQPFLLSASDARGAVEHAMQFRVRYGFNMQFSVVSRRLIERLEPHGEFFQSLFPDYYATNVCFLHASQIVVDPQPMIVIGVTPKSYGFFHANAREEEGRSFLDAEPTQAPPGTNINVGWLSAVEAIEREYGSDFGLTVNRRRYRWLQAVNVYERDRFRGGVTSSEMSRMNDELSALERWALQAGCALAAVIGLMFPKRIRDLIDYGFRRALRQYPDWTPARVDGRYADLLGVYGAAEQGLDVLREARH